MTQQERDRLKIKADVEAYLKKGGKIKTIPYGQSSESESTTTRSQAEQLEYTKRRDASRRKAAELAITDS